MKLKVSLASSWNPRIAAVLDGSITVEGVDLVTAELQAPDIFWRQLRFADFDVSEMSLASLSMLIDRGGDEWRALPIFPDRRFFHLYALARQGLRLSNIRDLIGRRVGVPDYQQTAAVWTRAALHSLYGIDAPDMTWFMERTPKLSHAGGVGFRGLDDVAMEYIPEKESIGSRLISGELDAALVYEPALLFNDRPTLLDRSPATLPDGTVEPLFADRAAEANKAFDQWGFFPANHCIVVRKSLLDDNPWLAMNIYEAFSESRSLYYQHLMQYTALMEDMGETSLVEDKKLRREWYPYGISANEKMLDFLFSELYRQKLTSRKLAIGDVFARGTLDL